MRWAKGLVAAAALGGAVAVAGCGDLTRALGGLEPGQEDFQTVKAPPLSLPPDYNLRPPTPGGRGAEAQRAVDAARQTVFGGDGERPPPVTDRSAGERALIGKVESQTRTVANIRSTVDGETEDLKAAERGFVDKVLKWDEDAADDETVNAGEEQGIIRTIIGGDEPPEIRRKGGIFD